jgi:hypothetical protein
MTITSNIVNNQYACTHGYARYSLIHLFQFFGISIFNAIWLDISVQACPIRL